MTVFACVEAGEDFRAIDPDKATLHFADPHTPVFDEIEPIADERPSGDEDSVVANVLVEEGLTGEAGDEELFGVLDREVERAGFFARVGHGPRFHPRCPQNCGRGKPARRTVTCCPLATPKKSSSLSVRTPNRPGGDNTGDGHTAADVVPGESEDLRHGAIKRGAHGEFVLFELELGEVVFEEINKLGGGEFFGFEDGLDALAFALHLFEAGAGCLIEFHGETGGFDFAVKVIEFKLPRMS